MHDKDIRVLNPTYEDLSEMMNFAFKLTSSVKYPVTIGATAPGILPKVLVIPNRNPAYLQEQKTKHLFVTLIRLFFIHLSLQ